MDSGRISIYLERTCHSGAEQDASWLLGATGHAMFVHLKMCEE